MLGLFDRLQGSQKPLVYLPKIDRVGSTGTVQADILNREDEQILGVIVSDVSIESVLGNENNNIWFIKVFINPLVSFIWIGVFIMIFSSMIAVLKK